MIDKDDQEEENEGHVDEKWLVSYSDMMTLLFGFFVMMYVMAMQDKGTIDSRLKQMSKDGFKGAAQLAPGATVVEKTKEELLIEIDEIRADLQNQVDDLISVKKDLQKLLAENAELAKKKEELELDLEKMASQLAVLNAKDSPIEEKEDVRLNRKIASLTKENTELEKKVAQLDSQMDKSFMMVYTQWETEKHDIDMVVEDPQGHVFNYRKRAFDSVAGEFVIDSRFGPGIETWVTNKIIPGEYKLSVKLYNQYGNNNDAIVKTSVYFNNQIRQLPELRLNTTGENGKVFRLVLGKNGEFEVK